MGELPSLLHGLIGVLGAALAATLGAIVVRLRGFGGLSEAARIGASGLDASTSLAERELARHHGWSTGRVGALIALLVLATVILFVWRPPQSRVIVAALLAAGCSALTVWAGHSFVEELKKSGAWAVLSYPMFTLLIGGFLSAYIIFPDLTGSTGSSQSQSQTPAPTPTPSVVVDIPSASPDASASSSATVPSASPIDGSASPPASTDTPIPTSSAQRTPTGGGREKEIDQLQADLKSKSAAKRLGAFKGAMDSGEDDLRNVALSTALKSSYADLKSVALPAKLRSSQSFVVNITGNDGNSDSTNLLEKIGQNLDVQVENYNNSTNTFIASTSASGVVATVGGAPFPHNRASHVVGERLSFSFDIARVVPGGGCNGVAVLSGDSGQLVGTMHCAGNYIANYKIAIDVLK